MRCPFCKQSTKIYNSRANKTTHETWRRHRCNSCKSTFTTREKIDWSKSTIVKASEVTRNYSYGILLSSILTASSVAGIPATDAIDLSNTVEQQLIAEGFFEKTQQESSFIRNACISVLKRYDKHLAIHYWQRCIRRETTAKRPESNPRVIYLS